MNTLSQIFNRRAARIDAKHGLDSRSDRTLATLGVQPKLDAKHPEHAAWLYTLAQSHRREELREDIARDEEEQAKHTSSWLLLGGLTLALGIETLGAVLLMKVVGASPTERLPFGFALAVTLVGVTAVVSHRAAAGDAKASPTGFLAKLRRSIFTTFVLTAYGLFVAAVTVIRIMNAAADSDGSLVEVVAQGVLMLATAVGPGFWAESLMRRRAPIRALEKRLRVLRRRLRQADREHQRAQANVNRVDREAGRWESEAARLGAVYATEHKLERAKAELETDDL